MLYPCVDNCVVQRSVSESGVHFWTLGGVLHRPDAPAVIRPDGTQEWWTMGSRNRTDAPAVITPGHSQEWWVMGQRHRTSGPAVIWERRLIWDRSQIERSQWWYLHNNNITEQVEQWMQQRELSWPWDACTQTEFELTWL